MRPFSRTNRPPAPSGSQYSSMLTRESCRGDQNWETPMDFGWVTTSMTASC